MSSVMTFERFAPRVLALLRVDATATPNPYDDLYEDLGLDSLQAYELVVIVESLAGCDVPPPVVPEIFTLQDAFEYYQSVLVLAGN